MHESRFDFEPDMPEEDLRSDEINRAIAKLQKHGYLICPVLLLHKEDIVNIAPGRMSDDQVDAIIPIVMEQMDSYPGEFLAECIGAILRDIVREHCSHIIKI